MASSTSESYYTEIGVKVGGVRVAFRLPWKTSPSPSGESRSLHSSSAASDSESFDEADHYWTFCQPQALPSPPPPSPPLPPKRAPSAAPECAKPPYPSSTVRGGRQLVNAGNGKRCKLYKQCPRRSKDLVTRTSPIV